MFRVDVVSEHRACIVYLNFLYQVIDFAVLYKSQPAEHFPTVSSTSSTLQYYELIVIIWISFAYLSQ